MKSNHYPSLELCKKLKEIGFPEADNDTGALYFKTHDGKWELGPKWTFTMCENEELYDAFSVMEMLDVIPRQIKVEGEFYEFSILKTKDNYILFYSHRGIDVGFNPNTLPNALAEMIIWLVENKYINFKD